MKDAQKKIFVIHVKVEEGFAVQGEDVTINMVKFHGTSESEFFTGEILPGGVDTQTYKKEKPGRLSARYIMEGTDCQGEKCRIFIENNGMNEDGKIMTTPKIITDSKALAWLMSAELEGRVIGEEDGICIEIYEKINASHFS